jgi:hypothetical protein
MGNVKKIFSTKKLSTGAIQTLTIAHKKTSCVQNRIINKEKLPIAKMHEAVLSLIIYKPINFSQIIKGKVCQTS